MEIKTELSKLDQKIKKELFIKLILFSLSALITTFILISSIISMLKDDKINEIKNYYELIHRPKIDLKHFQKLLDNKIESYNNIKNDIVFEKNDIILLKKFKIGFRYKNIVYVSSANKLLSMFFIYPFLIVLVISFMFYYWVVSLSAKSRMNELVNNAGKEAALANKNMNILTENLSHEAKTPLMVISSSIQELKERLLKITHFDCPLLEHCENKIINNHQDARKIFEFFDLIDINVQSIYTIIERIRDFKKVKYSNGNKTIYNIANASKNIMKLYKKVKFDITIDDELKNYGLECLRNEDLLNIFTNHIKNSIEANSTKILVNAGEFENNLLHIFIIDNGNGIPKKAIPKIFKANFSTKENGEVRGVGLYISKELLNSVGGDDILRETSNNGTVFELIVPAKTKND